METDKVDVTSVRVIDPPLLPGPADNPTRPARADPPSTHAPPSSTAFVPSPVVVHPRHRSYWGVWLLVTIAVLLGGWYAYPYIMAAMLSSSAGNTKPKGGRGAPVVVATARQGDMPIYLDEIGTVTALNTVTVHTRVDGQLNRVAFQEGQLVHEGDLLAEIDPRPFEVQLEQAQGQLSRDNAQLENAKVDLKRYQDAGEAVSRQQLDTAAASVSQFTGNLQTDQGAIDSAKLQLKYCQVTSPLTGKIGLKSVDQGNIVHASDANGLAVITQLQPIAVMFSVSQDDVQKIIEKMTAGQKLVADVYDRTLTHKVGTGELMAADSAIDQTTSKLRFKAVFPNTDSALYPNQFVNVRLLVDTKKNVVIVPTAAVQMSPDGNFIYMVKKESVEESGASTAPAPTSDDSAKGAAPTTNAAPQRTVEMRTVKVGDQQGDSSIILSGIDAGDVVVTDGVDKLQDGAKVTVGRSDATPKPGAATASGDNTTRESDAATRSADPMGEGQQPRKKRRSP